MHSPIQATRTMLVSVPVIVAGLYAGLFSHSLRSIHR
jgi:hypothetical protein